MLTGLQNIIGLGLIPLRDAEGVGGGGDDIQKKIDEAVAAAVEGLKKTNADLKAEKTEAKQLADDLAAKLEKLGGDDGIDALVQMRERLELDETGKLLAEGKHEEWFDQRATAMRADYERRLEAATAQITERDEALKGAQTKLHSTPLDVGMGQACDKAEITEAGAREHARMLAERQFLFDPESGQHVIKGEDGGTVFGKDGKAPKTMVEWIEEKREVPESRIWWPASRSAGLNGNNMPTNPDRRMETMGNMSVAQYREARAQKEG